LVAFNGEKKRVGRTRAKNFAGGRWPILGTGQTNVSFPSKKLSHFLAVSSRIPAYPVRSTIFVTSYRFIPLFLSLVIVLKEKNNGLFVTPLQHRVLMPNTADFFVADHYVLRNTTD
jgi:hypothetical protein